MPFHCRAAATIAALALLPLTAGPCSAAGTARVAALQVGLRARGFYTSTIDGVLGPATATAVRRLQRRTGLTPDGIAGPRTRAALGRYGKHGLGSRELAWGSSGWDVAALQFLLAWHGFPSGPLDGVFARRTRAAVRRYERWARLAVDGVAGPAVVEALDSPLPRCPTSLAPPLTRPIGDPFGPRGVRFHAGVDFPAPAGTPVAAAASGTVIRAGWLPGGWGNLVVIAHRGGVRTMYAHLSAIGVQIGQRVAVAAPVGRVGATGDASGPHLHFEVRVRGAAVDPLTALP